MDPLDRITYRAYQSRRVRELLDIEMPIYRYRCTACGAVEEVFAKVSDDAPTKCSSCGADGLEKMVSRTAFKLEGGGWYAQGYSGSSNQASSSGGGSDASTSTSDD